MRRFLTVLSIVLALSSPVVAKEQSEWEVLAKRAGCPAPVTMYEEPSYPAINAAYAWEVPGFQEERLYFVNFSRIPESWQLFIFYHEVGHCLQVRGGRISGLQAKGTYAVEWDADEYAIDKLASEHRLDGATIQAELHAYLHGLGAKSDPNESHGSFVERLQNGRLKSATRDVQS